MGFSFNEDFLSCCIDQKCFFNGQESRRMYLLIFIFEEFRVVFGKFKFLEFWIVSYRVREIFQVEKQRYRIGSGSCYYVQELFIVAVNGFSCKLRGYRIGCQLYLLRVFIYLFKLLQLGQQFQKFSFYLWFYQCFLIGFRFILFYIFLFQMFFFKWNMIMVFIIRYKEFQRCD